MSQRDLGRIVVMGVAGCGKTTLGTALAARQGIRFVDGDDLHPAESVALMTAGTPLTDAERRPWLAAVREALRQEESIVVACSALGRAHRDTLRSAGGVRFVFLDIGRAEALERLEARTGHYMRSDMLDGQLAALEPPAPDETDVVTLHAAAAVEDVLAALAGRER